MFKTIRVLVLGILLPFAQGRRRHKPMRRRKAISDALSMRSKPRISSIPSGLWLRSARAIRSLRRTIPNVGSGCP